MLAITQWRHSSYLRTAEVISEIVFTVEHHAPYITGKLMTEGYFGLALNSESNVLTY